MLCKGVERNMKKGATSPAMMLVIWVVIITLAILFIIFYVIKERVATIG